MLALAQIQNTCSSTSSASNHYALATMPAGRCIISTQMFTHDLTTESCLLCAAKSRRRGKTQEIRKPRLTVVCLSPRMWSFRRLCVRAHMSKRSRAASHLRDVSPKLVDKKIYDTQNSWSCLFFFFLNICQDAPLFAKHDRLVSSAKFFSQNILPSAWGCSGDKCGKREERVQNLR